MENTAYKKILDIHDQTIGMIRSLKVPPFPSQYKKYFDHLFDEMADEELRSEQKKFEYRISGNSADDANRYLELARRSVSSFVECHADIASIAQHQQNYIHTVPSNMLEKCVSFIDGLNEINLNLTLELDKAQKKIDSLNTDLDEAILSMTIDPLTKVSNRQLFLDDMENLLLTGTEKRLQMSLLMIDADNFKFTNDQYGHLVGDKILYFLAQSIKSLIRKNDKVYRFAGGTFMVVLQDYNEKEGMKLAEHIRTSVEKTSLLSNGQTIHVTVSIGMTAHKKGDNLDRIIGRAEKALYCAKKSNKNCLFRYDW